ncbi:MAG: DUF4439 domain-containing protein [Nocardioides sp.]|uniref:DUF4439 domain-containing protein n=1 Tax=Nocardioides sp. TaxID=35761 RepID=UPI0039E43029
MSLRGLQRALAAEHAAVYLDAALAGLTSREDALYDLLATAWEDHEAARNRLQEAISEAGATPVGTAAGYRLPSGIGSVAGVRRAALRIEQRCAAAYLANVARVTGAHRGLLVELLGDCAVRELDFGGTPNAFPGS